MPQRSKRLCGGCQLLVCICKKKPPTKHPLYDHAWSVASKEFLKRPENHFCRMCGMNAGCVDHIIPHRGDWVLFWDENNWQPLCDHTGINNCHGKKTAMGL